MEDAKLKAISNEQVIKIEPRHWVRDGNLECFIKDKTWNPFNPLFWCTRFHITNFLEGKIFQITSNNVNEYVTLVRLECGKENHHRHAFIFRKLNNFETMKAFNQIHKATAKKK